MADLLLRDVRLVALDALDHPEGVGAPGDHAGDAAKGRSGAAPEPVDVLITNGTIAEVGPRIEGGHGIPEVDGGGRWAMPGLWDHHVHVQQWGLTRSRLDTSGVRSVADAQELVRHRLTSPLPATGAVIGWGHRCATWDVQPTVAALDEVSTTVPIILISGDGHHGWLNTRALELLRARRTEDVLLEDEWFAVYDRMSELPGAVAEADRGLEQALTDALGLGVVGLTDLEFGQPWEQWRHRKAEGLPLVRARVGVYPDGLDAVIEAGLRTGDLVSGTLGLVTMGPLKIISDGSLNTRTAWCCEPYADGGDLEHPRGAANLSADKLTELLTRAQQHGLEVALHAIGDAAVHQALETFAATGAVGGIEHAQLVSTADLEVWRRLPVRASVQPAHLLDDRVVTEQCWPDRTDRTFSLRTFLDQGIEVVLGSDAPVSPLDPWLAMAAAVHRGPTDAPAWHPEQALTLREALACSVDGQRVAAGGRGDVVLLDVDPLATRGHPTEVQADALRAMSVSATIVDGSLASGDLG
ncbi:amidohydrolase [Ornithinimicrobium sp. Y1847]|uniref:amidohydrolase n=1 Tax=unclassified Ornithinimicrobium TaxID=2615080 RepID=UPI003B67E891